MRCLLLIYSDEAESVYNQTGEESEALMARWFEYTTEMQQAEKMLSRDALHLSNTAKTVRLSDGEAITTDGPFAETRERSRSTGLGCKNAKNAWRRLSRGEVAHGVRRP